MPVAYTAWIDASKAKRKAHLILKNYWIDD